MRIAFAQHGRERLPAPREQPKQRDVFGLRIALDCTEHDLLRLRFRQSLAAHAPGTSLEAPLTGIAGFERQLNSKLNCPR